LPPTFDVANGCTLFFDPRYDTECKYDYFYVDFFNGTEWRTLARFNAASNNPGDECGTPGPGSPDYWANTDTDQPHSADWQERSNPSEPAFYSVITPDTLLVTSGPMFRWRFTSDGAWSDADGRGDTDGAAFIDNVWVRGDDEQYSEDFESGLLDTNYWSLTDPDGVIDQWHMVEGAGPITSGMTCLIDSSYAFRGRPEGGYPNGTSWENGWFYRLMSPAVSIQNTGCVVQYDQFTCALDYTCDYADEKVRVYNSDYGKWCPWTVINDLIIFYGCTFWNYDIDENLSKFYGPEADSIQVAWELMDVSSPGDFCEGKHKQTDMLVDNVSIGFYDANATEFWVRYLDLFQDSFHESICTYNSLFDAYSMDTLDYYSVRGGAPEIAKTDKFYLSVTDKDGLASVELWGSIDGGSVWKSKAMVFADPWNPQKPDLGGEYYENFCPADFAGGAGVEAVPGGWFWEKGIELWHYVKAEDDSGNVEYWPPEVDPGHAGHTGTREDYAPNCVMSILPVYPDDYTGSKILLVDGYPRWNIDYTECMAENDNKVERLVEIYEETLTDAGYCFDVYNISGGGSSAHIHPLQYTDYDCVFWFTGPYFSNYTVDKEAQIAIRDYMVGGGKVVFCGDMLAYSMDPNGSNEDSLGGEFLGGILGTDYLQDMEGPFDKPYVYAAAVETLSIFGTPTGIDLDSIAIYRECPTLRDMSYIQVIGSPPAGYTAQPLMHLTNPLVGSADEVIYVEYLGAGQCVFVNFDLSASVTHERSFCNGVAASPMPGFVSGVYDGRVDLVRTILEDIFGLPSNGGGPADVDDPPVDHRWTLHQNVPNPCVGATEIRYDLARPAMVNIKVYNTQGQVVQVLERGAKEPGPHAVSWNGRNLAGVPVSSGVYFYKIEAGPFTATRKMLVLR
ncbi:MAG: FlgD immunoglobulin-like domain containing protein, partial [Candidatus Eisenbacteria bacterium]